VRTARALLMAMAVCALLIGARPMAGNEQFPRGLMSAAPRGGNQGGSCTIETHPLAFPAYDPLAGTDVDAIGQVIYICNVGGAGSGGGDGGRGGGGGGGPPDGRGGGPGTRAQDLGIRIELDQGYGNSFQPRTMVGAGYELLGYNIYLDATHRTVWGNGAGSTEVYFNATPPDLTPVTLLAYGRIFRGQDVPAGSYTDVVGVRIEF